MTAMERLCNWIKELVMNPPCQVFGFVLEFRRLRLTGPRGPVWRGWRPPDQVVGAEAMARERSESERDEMIREAINKGWNIGMIKTTFKVGSDG
jgi:hypothetical protein